MLSPSIFTNTQVHQSTFSKHRCKMEWKTKLQPSNLPTQGMTPLAHWGDGAPSEPQMGQFSTRTHPLVKFTNLFFLLQTLASPPHPLVLYVPGYCMSPPKSRQTVKKKKVMCACCFCRVTIACRALTNIENLSLVRHSQEGLFESLNRE